MSVREAAERLVTRWDSGDYQYWDGNCGEFQPNRDGVAVARAYLAEHDETASDEAWLESIGGKWEVMPHAYRFNHRRLNVWIRTNGQWWLEFDSMRGGQVGTYSKLKTRGDVHRAFAALGIELQEQSK